jgi:phosphate transport system substrate-binding protein
MRIVKRRPSRNILGRRRVYGITVISALSLLGSIVAFGPTTPASAAIDASAAALSGSGSSFAAPAIETWVDHATTAPYNLKIQYSSTNSGTGRYEFTNQTTDWAVSDIGYVGDTDNTPPSFPFNFIPITAGGIAFMYNIPGLTKQLHLTSYTACALLTGGITNWNNSLLAADNPGVTLPNLAVVPVTESDSAGTNYVLEEWCIAEQPALWGAFVQAQIAQPSGPNDGVALSATAPNSNWPGIKGGLDDQTTTAVASDVANNSGAIGPVQVKYAQDLGFDGNNLAKSVALVKNASGDFTAPSPVDVASALAYASQLPDGTHKLDFAGVGPNVYNPSTYSYLLTPTTGWPTAKGQTLSAFVDYVLTLGQQIAPSFGYASLGLSLEQYGINAIKANVPGAVAPTAAEQNAYSCGDLTQDEVAAGVTTPKCGVVTATAAPPSASAGTATGAPVTASSSGTPAKVSTAASSASSSAPSSPSSPTSGSSVSGKSSTQSLGGSDLSSGSSSASGASPGGVDPAVSLSGVAAMPNTGGNPVPFALGGLGLLMIGTLGRRLVLKRRATGAAK